MGGTASVDGRRSVDGRLAARAARTAGGLDAPLRMLGHHLGTWIYYRHYVKQFWGALG
jgi:hypothetical protein